ncbi:MAG: glycoside hydrolase family 13 protein [Tannerellaceae bacterium]|nr:glycoside hydrolase family 13 protein [Tannerellaceae bacterium]
MKKSKQPAEIMVKRVEPLSWWIGMKTPLQLMIYGENLAGSTVHTQRKGVKIQKIHKADSPNYLFVDIEIAPTTQAGKCIFEIKKGTQIIQFDYLLEKRRKDSARRTSFSAVDTIYLVMPDRFANGDTSNDSTPFTVEKSNRKNPSGRHGGDLQGIINHLDYIADLGMTTLWITPPQLDNEPEQSYHGYACADYYQVDPRYGDNELYRQLVTEAHWRDMQVIMDAVPNHCGMAHWWMQDLPFWNWIHHHPKEFLRSSYRLVSIMDPNGSQRDLKQTVDGWFDNSMPDMALENPFVRQYFLQLYCWWIEWADLDGLRVDTFPYNDREGISWWTASILNEYPNLNIVAECWHSSPSVIAYWMRNNQNKDGYNSHLPSAMDFPLQEAIQESLSKDSSGWMEGFNRLYEAVGLDFIYPDPMSLLIFLDNHDVARFADTMKGNKDKIKMGLTLLATLRGIPQLYYGTEYGFRSTNLSQGDGAARRDFPGGWKKDRKDLFTGDGATPYETEIFQHTCRLFNWRKTAVAIHQGALKHFLPVNNTYGYFRYTAKESVFVFFNPTRKEVALDWEHFSEGLHGYEGGTDILTGETLVIGETYFVKPHQSLVIELKPITKPKPVQVKKRASKTTSRK